MTTPTPALRGALLAAAATLLLGAVACKPEPERAAVTPSPSATAAATQASSPTAAAATSTPAATGASGAAGVIVPPSPDGTRYSYACAEGKTFSILAYPAVQERVTLMIEGKTLELKQERSGSGTRHSDGNYTLVAKGVDAFIEQNGTQTYRDCQASRP